MQKVSLEERHCYYGVLLGFLYAVGNHQAYIKMGLNDEDGVYPVQKVLHEYNLRDRIDEEIRVADNIRLKALENLNHWSQKVGFLPISEDGKQKILKFLENEPRREYVRNRVQKAFRSGEVLSIADFIEKRLEVERKKREKEQSARE